MKFRHKKYWYSSGIGIKIRPKKHLFIQTSQAQSRPSMLLDFIRNHSSNLGNFLVITALTVEAVTALRVILFLALNDISISSEHLVLDVDFGSLKRIISCVQRNRMTENIP